MSRGHHAKEGDFRIGSDLDSRVTKGDSRRPSHRTHNMETVHAPPLGEDPYGYSFGQANYADLERQLIDIEHENRESQQDWRNTAEKSPQYPAPPSITKSPPYVSHERPSSDRENYTSGSSSDEISSPDDTPKKSPRSSSSKPKSRSSTTTSTLQKGYRETRHFAGGMIHHPTESTKHYSILRHSHGLVFYQGTSTSVSISIFADSPLPENRTIWLKPKSWSITSKNRASFQRQTDTLLNVTPGAAIKVDQINPSDERAWQRDILQFEKKTRRGPRSTHVLQETDVVRIPADAGDGYFQLMLCGDDEEEMLCMSPAFRILSVSTNMGAISGSNWATLPLELGAIALSIQAKRYVGAAFLPAKLAVKGKADPYMPAHAGKAKVAGKLAYGATGASGVIGAHLAAFNSKYHEERDGTFTPVWKIDDDYETGPKQPYPISFVARCDADGSASAQDHIMPMTKLINVPDTATYKLCGHYFGWCAAPNKHNGTDKTRKRDHWFQAVIVVSPVNMGTLDRVTMSRANQKEVHIQILADNQEQPLNNAEIKVDVYGCLRPWDQELETMLAEDLKQDEEVAHETVFINEMSDIRLTQTILDEPAWGPEVISRQEKDAKPKPKAHGMERVRQEYTEKRLTVQRKIDQVPLHKMGVRMPVDKMKDKSVVMNGFYIKR